MITIADEITLPDQIVTETLAFLAKRGGGKSNAAVVLAEQMWDAAFQWVAIDPKGDWWGIRASADGKGEGLPVLIVGGQHGDLPLSSNQGSQWAHQVINRNLTVLLDVSLFSKGEQIQFVTDFAETLFRAIRQAPRPLHLFLEEAEEFLPQRVTNDTARMVGAYSKIAKQGRNAGLGVSLVTQRSASLNKDALSQTDTLVLFRTPSPHDRKAVIAWAEHSGDVKEIAESLSSLKPGESWMLSPGYLGLNQRFTWHRRRTFDSGATPVVGQKRPEPASLASIDLAEIKEQMAEEIERAAENDPKVMRSRITALEKALAAKAPGEPVEVIREVEVQVVPPAATDAARLMVDFLAKACDSAQDIVAACESYVQAPAQAVSPAEQRHPAPAPVPADDAAPRRRSRPAPPDPGTARLDKRERKILTVLAQYPEGRTQNQIAILTGYSVRASTIGAGLSMLRKAGYVTTGQPIQATPEGVDALGTYDPLPTGSELLAYWLAHAGGKREALLLQVLWDARPASVTAQQISDATGYSTEASTIGAGMSRLRALGLAKGWAIDPDFVAAVDA